MKYNLPFNRWFVRLLLSSLFILIWVFIFFLLGFRINKEYFTFNQDKCIQEAWIGDLDDCVYWARYEDLIKDRDLEEEWESKASEITNCPRKCTQEYRENYFTYYLDCTVEDGIICDFNDYVDYIHYSNSSYLKSKEKDSFLYQCAEKYCRKPSLVIIK